MCTPAELVPARAGFAIRDGRHPLLLAKGVDVVPFDLALFAEERTLLVSGPNTGGKTVLLKALGFIVVGIEPHHPSIWKQALDFFENCLSAGGFKQHAGVSTIRTG